MFRQTLPAYLGAVAGLLLWHMSAGALAADVKPALVFDFAEKDANIVRDLSGNGLHGMIRGDATYVKGPTGPALRFAGTTTILLKDHPELATASELTIDLWFRADRHKKPGYLVDKGSERCTVTVGENGQIRFGLKGGRQRADLLTGRLRPKRWRRLTCVFKRPTLTVYLNGRKVGTKAWPHEIDRPGPLSIGSRHGRSDFFRGAIDQLRIYTVARPPRRGDGRVSFRPSSRVYRGAIKMRKTKDDVTVDTGPMQFQLDTRQGIVRRLTVDGKALIADNETPPLFATLMESAEYDGVTDYAPRKFLDGAYSCEPMKVSSDGDLFKAEGKGAIAFPDGDAIRFRLELEAKQGSAHLEMRAAFERSGAFKDRFVRQLGLCQPLALNLRKRIIQAGDQGLRWDTRHHYLFHLHTMFFEEPDRNWWRHFFVDQQTDHSYTIWRSENTDTSGLYAFRGRRAAGWMTAYDQGGGALFAYRDMPKRAPKCLYVNADDGGEARVYFRSPTHAAFDPRDPVAAASVFGKPHEIDWVFFAGEEVWEAPDRTLAKTWNVDSLPSDPPNRPAPLSDEINLWTAAPAKSNATPLVSGGIPLPRGPVTDPAQARVFVRGKEAPLHATALGYWPDRSVKWLGLGFPLDVSGGPRFSPGKGEGKKVPFNVTLRHGKPTPCVLRYGKGVQAGKIHNSIRVTDTASAVSINTGPLALRLSVGARWLASAKLNGREMLRDDGRPQAYVDFLRTTADYPVGTTHPTGAPDPGPVLITKLTVEERGPLRAVVRLEGLAKSREPARVILRVEAYAGRPFAKLSHTLEFLHKDCRNAFVRRMGVHLPLAIAKTEQRVLAGGQAGPVGLRPAKTTGLRQTSHANYELWQSARDGKFRVIRESAHRSRGWLGIRDARSGLAQIVHDLRPFKGALCADGLEENLAIALPHTDFAHLLHLVRSSGNDRRHHQA